MLFAGMIAGGSGITPMYQVLCGLLRDPKDKTQISLVFGNITEEDILIREELDALAAAHPQRFRLHYVLNTPPAQGWTGGSGFVSTDIIKAQLPPPGRADKGTDEPAKEPYRCLHLEVGEEIS